MAIFLPLLLHFLMTFCYIASLPNTKLVYMNDDNYLEKARIEEVKIDTLEEIQDKYFLNDELTNLADKLIENYNKPNKDHGIIKEMALTKRTYYRRKKELKLLVEPYVVFNL